MLLVKAFIIGGLICLIGQLIMDLTPFNVTPGHILVGFVSAGAVLSALGLYQPLVNFGGAGATIPLSGFGHTLTQGVFTAMETKGLLGAFSGGIAAAGAGIVASVVFGYVVAVVFRPHG